MHIKNSSDQHEGGKQQQGGIFLVAKWQWSSTETFQSDRKQHNTQPKVKAKAQQSLSPTTHSRMTPRNSRHQTNIVSSRTWISWDAHVTQYAPRSHNISSTNSIFLRLFRSTALIEETWILLYYVSWSKYSKKGENENSRQANTKRRNCGMSSKIWQRNNSSEEVHMEHAPIIAPHKKVKMIFAILSFVSLPPMNHMPAHKLCLLIRP